MYTSLIFYKSDFWYIHVLDTFLTSNCAYYFPVELFASKYYAAEDIVGDLKYSCTILTYFYLVEQQLTSKLFFYFYEVLKFLFLQVNDMPHLPDLDNNDVCLIIHNNMSMYVLTYIAIIITVFAPFSKWDILFMSDKKKYFQQVK